MGIGFLARGYFLEGNLVIAGIDAIGVVYLSYDATHYSVIADFDLNNWVAPLYY